MESSKESRYHAEKSHVEHQMILALEDLVNVNWDSDILKSKIQELMKKRFCVEQQLYKMKEPIMISENNATKIKRRIKSRTAAN